MSAIDSPFHTILVGDDGGPDAERAVAVALSLGKQLQAKVVLLGVLPPPSAESQAEGYGVTNPAEARRKLEEHLEGEALAGQQAGIDVVAEVVEGNPEKSLEKRAENGSADLIVVGHRQISRIRTWMEGSAAETLMRRCPVSVLVVHDP